MNDDEDDVMKVEKEPPQSCATRTFQDKSVSLASSTDGEYVFRHALRVHPKSIQNGHNMGVTLSLMIIFNLALAHHLMGIDSQQLQQQQQQSPSNEEDMDGKLLKKALQLYELAYQLHVDEQQLAAAAAACTPPSPLDPQTQQQQRMGMLRFTMIVSNNLGEIHRVSHNTVKHRMCLQHLLSTIMYMVDGHFLEQQPSGGSRSSSSSTARNPAMSQEELDGFLRNTSPLMLKDICASAA